jgi:6-phosphogluconolactonase
MPTHHFLTLDQLSLATADHLVRSANHAIQHNGRFTLALSGGNTPKRLYTLLAQNYQEAVDWSKVLVFWGDERCVAPDDPDSCYKMAKDSLLDHLPFAPQNIFRIMGEIAPADGAHAYTQTLQTVFGAHALPALDMVLLGMGDDGHTASLFPNTTALDEQQKWVVENYAPQVKNPWRITLTYPVLNNAHEIMVLVAGSSKKTRLDEVFDTSPPPHLPIQHIQPTHGELLWMIATSDQ